MSSVNCPICQNLTSTLYKGDMCLKCGHPFNLQKWQAHWKKVEREYEERKRKEKKEMEERKIMEWENEVRTCRECRRKYTIKERRYDDSVSDTFCSNRCLLDYNSKLRPEPDRSWWNPDLY